MIELFLNYDITHIIITFDETSQTVSGYAVGANRRIQNKRKKQNVQKRLNKTLNWNIIVYFKYLAIEKCYLNFETSAKRLQHLSQKNKTKRLFSLCETIIVAWNGNRFLNELPNLCWKEQVRHTALWDINSKAFRILPYFGALLQIMLKMYNAGSHMNVMKSLV